MQFSTYLKTMGISRNAFARKSGLSVATISRLAAGLIHPGPATVKTIARITENTVTAADWQEAYQERTGT